MAEGHGCVSVCRFNGGAKIEATGTFGGGYTQIVPWEQAVDATQSALMYELFGRRPVRLICPTEIHQELRHRGLEV